MLKLSRLKTSLTKHGAHKVANLLDRYPANEVLDHLSGSVPGIRIERAQAKNNLSAYSGSIPAVWSDVKDLGNRHVRALTLLAIIFSHHRLIEAFANSVTGPYKGRLVRGAYLDDKEFTNTANNLEELGFGVNHTVNGINYDFSSLFKLDGLGTHFATLMKLKLEHAKWDHSESIADALIQIEAHRALATTEAEFRSWLANAEAPSSGSLTYDDLDYFEDDITAIEKPPSFLPGHVEKKIGVIDISKPLTKVQASLLHNQMQNGLYKLLKAKYGADNVGTEQSSGAGTKIDAVVKTSSQTFYYEIKTAKTAKACIRQAISQLLEYAYWTCEPKADKLVIVSQNKLDEKSKKYLAYLNSAFSIPISYVHYDLKKNAITEI